MSRHDYKPRKRKSGKRSTHAPGSSGWAWLAIGLAIGSFGGFLFYLSKRPAPPHHVVFSVSSESTQTAKLPHKSKNTVAPEKPKFDFYTLLPKLQVDVPKPTHSLQSGGGIRSSPSAPSSQVTSPPNVPEKVNVPGRYILQIASFGTEGQANVLKAKLAFRGIVANVSSARVKNYTWYRVQVGPYRTLTKLNAMLARLASEHIKPLVIKMNG